MKLATAVQGGGRAQERSHIERANRRNTLEKS
jgi:hypothetical protein